MRFAPQGTSTGGQFRVRSGGVTYRVTVDWTPAPTALPLDTATTVFDAASQIYTEPGATQVGVAPGTISETRVAILRGVVRDRGGGGIANVRVTVNPLINWLWIGSLLLIVGSLVAAWPDREPDYVPVRAQRVGQPAYQPGD